MPTRQGRKTVEGYPARVPGSVRQAGPEDRHGPESPSRFLRRTEKLRRGTQGPEEGGQDSEDAFQQNRQERLVRQTGHGQDSVETQEALVGRRHAVAGRVGTGTLCRARGRNDAVCKDLSRTSLACPTAGCGGRASDRAGADCVLSLEFMERSSHH